MMSGHPGGREGGWTPVREREPLPLFCLPTSIFYRGVSIQVNPSFFAAEK
ncbi:Hypothetical protein FKW44_006629 [Caligus rogercresseyi]|uniref:Uncharacterized protein n=1 Tax=Caligus rogercresseyi TaxID=217165 RepID=A0A7T8KDM4_CALRO|nr:Hypothetical protein FKW44_006629 [Caligus rogercresseyi]